jgi:transposase-like protein
MPKTEPVAKKAGRPAGAKSSKLTPRQQAEACSLWAAGEATLAQLAAKYGKNPETFSRLFERKGVKKGEKAAEVAAATAIAVERDLVADSVEHAAKVRQAKDENHKAIVTLRKLTMHEVVTAKKAGTPLGAILNNLKALDLAMKVVRTGQQGEFDVLGVSTDPAETEDTLSELRIADLSHNQVELLRNQVHRPADEDEDFEPALDDDHEDPLV